MGDCPKTLTPPSRGTGGRPEERDVTLSAKSCLEDRPPEQFPLT